MTSNNKLPEESYQMCHDDVEHVVPSLELIQTEVPAVLAKEPARRAYLVEWLPCTLRDTQIELVYSTNTHGRTLERLYANCANAKYTIMLVEVLDTGAVIGFFATDVWRRTSRVHGDGGCFLFKLSPSAKNFSWTRRSVRADVFESTAALAEQFMMSTDTYLSMGGSPDGSCGLRLNEDLTKGHSDYSLTFENEPLAGNGMLDFDVGIVEVYHVFRPIDGKPLDMRAGRTLETSSELNVPSLFAEST
eukprot:CAMPEP_0116018466 /NCGR_PEP_ID=MMETSP0321-20121206/8665_1 /TAXON_ID=163516 /ORGANISM="Leptocylindrus danicus var. danicus, Strain B650" /LENGTH=246 /DNA_ID=CAMNT_0003488865 /DNA_START=503 /DNA_END=1243 /DNA_ORIENTATION=+